MSPSPIFTVVIPLYNTERYIRRTLKSVQAQTFSDFEVIVVDDGSQDLGPLLVEAMLAHDSRIRIVSQANRGLAGARNTGIREARGRYIAFLDADDLWLPRKLEMHKVQLDSDPSIGLAYAPSLFIDHEGVLFGFGQSPKLKDITPDHVLCRNPVGNGSAPVVRREVFEAIEFDVAAPEGPRRCWFDESFRQSEDIELWTRIAATTAWRIEGLATPLTLYRVHTGALSSNTAVQLATWYRFREKISSIAPELIARSGARAEAYQLRYLARRTAINGDGWGAARLSVRSLWQHPRIALEEPGRTLQTLLFSLAAATFPVAAFNTLKKFAFGRGQSRPAAT